MRRLVCCNDVCENGFHVQLVRSLPRNCSFASFAALRTPNCRRLQLYSNVYRANLSIILMTSRIRRKFCTPSCLTSMTLQLFRRLACHTPAAEQVQRGGRLWSCCSRRRPCIYMRERSVARGVCPHILQNKVSFLQS